jgi:phosphate transport system permease protein
MPAAAGGGAPAPPGDTNGAATIEGASLGDRIYKVTTFAFALVTPLLVLTVTWVVFSAGWPAFRTFGVGFLTGSTWDPVHTVFGTAPAIYGTLVSSAIALIVATPLAIGVAVFLSEFAPTWIRQPIAFLVDLLAAIPSVVYGLWGIFVLVPFLRDHFMPFLTDTLHLGGWALFEGPAYGKSMLAAGLILAIMVLPYVSAVTREVLVAVPRSQREAALALGATRWEMIAGAVIPYARSGIIGGVILGLARALGETMAVTMVIGNTQQIATSLFAPGQTMASLIASQFNEATDDMHRSALLATGAILFGITLAVNVIARWLVWRVARTD